LFLQSKIGRGRRSPDRIVW